MSEMIDNRNYRQKIVKEMIEDLRNGKSLEMVKVRFNEVFRNIPPSMISEMWRNLVSDGVQVEEIRYLSDLYESFIKGSIKEIQQPELAPGHPIHTFTQENIAIKKLIDEQIHLDMQLFNQNDSRENIQKLLADFTLLWDIDKHYTRKEHLLFPYLEKHGLYDPSKVMWGYDDDVRDSIKTAKKMLKDYSGNKEEVLKYIEEAIYEIDEMIFKEEKVFFPVALTNITEDEWIKIMDESDVIGYCLIEPVIQWEPTRKDMEDMENDKSNEAFNGGYIKFSTGLLSAQEIMGIFNYLPVDITFIDKNDVVKFFSQTKERIFMRTKAVIGRQVQNCHPPSSVHIVEKLLSDFKSGKKNKEDEWSSFRDV